MQKFLSLFIQLSLFWAATSSLLPTSAWAMDEQQCTGALGESPKPANPFKIVQGNPEVAKPKIADRETVNVRLSPMALNEMNSGIDGWSKITDYYVRQYRDQIHQILFTDGESAPRTFFEQFILGNVSANRSFDFQKLEQRWDIFKDLLERNQVPDYLYESQTIYLQRMSELIEKFGFIAVGDLLTEMENLGFSHIRFTRSYQPGLPLPQGLRLPKIARQGLKDLEDEIQDQAAPAPTGTYRKVAPVKIKMTESLGMLRILYFLSLGESDDLKGSWADGSTLFHQYAKQGDIESMLMLYQLGVGGLASPDGFHIKDQAGKLATAYLNPLQRAQLWTLVNLPAVSVTMTEFRAVMLELTESNWPDWCFPKPQVAELMGYLPRPLRPLEKPRHGLRLVTPDFVP